MTWFKNNDLASIPGMTRIPEPGYRADIDGLRAVAVLCVVGFHAVPEWLGGGFCGVDIFFVISGYLISGIIRRELAQGSFSFSRFYTRRVLRIFPALALVLFTCLVAGWLVLLPAENARLGWQAAAGAAFVSNLALWGEAGYFDVAAATKPLLHLWSLGIEEQFYIVWPLLLAFLWRRRWSFAAVAGALAAASFLLNVATVASHPVAAFYSPLSRGWELMAGALLAHLQARGAPAWPGSAESRSVAGLLLMGLGVVLLNQQSQFPGWWALLPVVGAGLLISAPGAWINRKFLSQPVLVWVGLISYPLYLWHWPILSFARILNGQTPSLELRLGAVLLAFVLAWITWRIIERPMRFGGFGRAANCALLCAGMALAGCVGYGLSVIAQGMNAAYTSTVAGKAAPRFPLLPCPDSLQDQALPLNVCARSAQEPLTRALFGDSHADDKFPGIAQLDHAHGWVLAASTSCPPLNGVSLVAEVTQCQQRSERATRWLLAHPQIKLVVLSFWGNTLLPSYAADHTSAARPRVVTIAGPAGERGAPMELFERGLENTISILERGGKSLVLLVDTPELPFFAYDCVRRAAAFRCRLSREEVLARQSQLRAMVGRMHARHPGMRIYDPLDWLCPGRECRMPDDTMSFYRDSHHLSLAGSDYYASRFLPWLENAPPTLAAGPGLSAK
ncbi:MAG TPA: acyltransferase family protein [Burkholderiales bacterium]|nr:acyltransferase family protein [Burkholderiales bacterium]